MPMRATLVSGLLIAAAACGLAASGTAAPAGEPLLAAAAAAPTPTLATEDTMYMELPEVLVTAPRMTLDEIIDRVAHGESRRESLLTDQSFTATFRVVRIGNKGKADNLVAETVARVYKKKPDLVRTVTVRQWRSNRKRDAVGIDFRPNMSEEIVNFAFRPESRRDYRYRIVGRDVRGGRVVYRIAFEPRAPVDLLPKGTVWVETSDFVIVRQEIEFARSPAPLIIKNVRRMVVERAQEDGHWVLRRMLVRLEGTLPLPVVGKVFDVSLRFDEYENNHGIEDAFFKEGRE